MHRCDPVTVSLLSAERISLQSSVKLKVPLRTGKVPPFLGPEIVARRSIGSSVSRLVSNHVRTSRILIVISEYVSSTAVYLLRQEGIKHRDSMILNPGMTS